MKEKKHSPLKIRNARALGGRIKGFAFYSVGYAVIQSDLDKLGFVGETILNP